MKNDLKTMLSLLMAGCLLAACSAPVMTGQDTPIYEDETPATQQSSVSESAPVSTPEPAPEPETFTDVQALGDFSEGLAFAKVTLPDGIQEYAYITADGQIAFTLPDGYVYGWPFHEGYAAICDVEISDIVGEAGGIAGSHRVYETFDDPERRYNLVDTQGNLCFEEGAYCFVGTYSEGKVLTHKIERDYNGTEDTIAFVDLAGNALWEVDQEKFLDVVDDMVCMPWRSYYQDGKVWLFRIENLDTYNTRYDEYGNIAENCGAGWNADPNHTYDWFFSVDRNYVSGNWTAQYNVYQPATAQEYEINISTADELNDESQFETGVPFVNDRMIITKNTGKGFCIFDLNGSITVDNSDLSVKGIDYESTGIDGYWIVTLENGYYGILDTDGNLAFEPVQGMIYHMGEGLFYLSGTNEVVDSNGIVQYTIPSGYEFYSKEYGGSPLSIKPENFHSTDGFYHAGIATVMDSNGVRRFIDKTGRLLINASDFTAAT